MSTRKSAIPGSNEEVHILQFTGVFTVGILPSFAERDPVYLDFLERYRGNTEQAQQAYIRRHMQIPHVLSEMPGTTGPAVLIQLTFQDLEDLPHAGSNDRFIE